MQATCRNNNTNTSHHLQVIYLIIDDLLLDCSTTFPYIFDGDELDLHDIYGYNESDWLYIYDGSNNSGRQLVRACEMPANPFYKSSDNQLFLKIMTYTWDHARGFKLRWGESA